MTSPKIVVLDGHTLNPGDLSWDALASLGTLEVHARTSPEQVVSRAAGAAIVLTNKTPLRREHIERLPDLKYIGVIATGYDIVDAAAARGRGIPVCNAAGYSSDSVTQVVFALLLELTHRVGAHSASIATEWPASPDFAYWKAPLVELAGKTMGVVGFGRIGKRVGAVARAMGMKVAVRGDSAREGADLVVPSVEDLLATSDVVSLHCPLTPETAGMINTARLGRMKKSAYLINTGRGKLINEADLARALNEGVIAGAGLDVLSVEPPPADNPLLSARNCVITPHYAWASVEARRRLMDIVVANVSAFLAGRPVNVVNP